MEEKKYYTPTIEEIIYQLTNVGEVYGVNKKGELLKFQTHPDIVNTLHKFIEMNDFMADREGFKYSVNPTLYKIKYLDAEDIESLGFVTRLEPNIDGKGYSKENSFIYKKVLNSPLCGYPPEMNVLYIAHKAGDTLIYLTHTRCIGIDDFKVLPEVHLFHGIIKNKSELIKVLKQIGFYGDKL